jgi:hypothetical protein
MPFDVFRYSPSPYPPARPVFAFIKYISETPKRKVLRLTTVQLVPPFVDFANCGLPTKEPQAYTVDEEIMLTELIPVAGERGIFVITAQFTPPFVVLYKGAEADDDPLYPVSAS